MPHDAEQQLPVCGIGDHKWELHIESGGISIHCVDPCDIDPDTYDYSRKKMPACWWVPDSGDAAYGELPVALEYDRGPRDYESGAYDDWSIAIKPRVEPVAQHGLKVHVCDGGDTYEGCAFSCCATGPCKCPPETPADERCQQERLPVTDRKTPSASGAPV